MSYLHIPEQCTYWLYIFIDPLPLTMTKKCVLWSSAAGKVKYHNKRHAVAHGTDHFHVYAPDNTNTAMLDCALQPQCLNT